jgi:hypothetical protein
MAKEEENLARVRPGDYIDEVEQKVKLETARILAAGVPRVDKKYTHIEFPDFGKDLKAKLDWEIEEIRRCQDGYDGLPSKYYFYFNHCFIKNKDRGKIRPDFRTMDLEWFKFLERVENTKPVKGIVCVKRRQVGMSWKAAADIIHSCQFNNYYEIGMNSKTESDSRILFSKVKMIYRNQSSFLRGATSTDRRDAMVFDRLGRDAQGNNIVVAGTGSSIMSFSPVPTAYASNQFKKMILDEAGETETLEGIWANGEDCIVQDGIRTGIPIFFGTMGSVDKAGRGLMEFWMNHKTYDLEQFAFWGYNELIMDELGNDDIEESVRSILYKRKKLEGGSKTVYNKFIQKYPLNEADAFLSIGGGGVGNPITISTQEMNLYSLDIQAREGKMKLVGETPQFEPNQGAQDSHIVMYEPPKPLINGYRAVLDPAEDDDVKKSRDSSDLGFTIAARPYGMLPLRLVLEYCHRPLKLEEAYMQFAIACKLYNCKITIEMNKGGWRAFKWFEQHYPELLELTPKSATSAKGGVELKYGVKMTTEKKSQMEGLLEEYIDNSCLPDDTIKYKGIPSRKLLKQFKVFGADHEDDDLAVSWGWQLILDQSDKRVVKSAQEAEKNKLNHRMERQGNRIVMVVDKNPNNNVSRLKVPKHPLIR